MPFMESIIFVRFESQVELFITKIIWFFAVAQPGQFQAESGAAVAEINDLVTAVGRWFFPNDGKTKRFLIKCNTFFQV